MMTIKWSAEDGLMKSVNKISFLTYGCKVNQVDTDRMISVLSSDYKILDNGFLRITHYWQEPDDNDVYANGTVQTIEIPPCDLHSDGTWEEIDSIEDDLPQWWKETNLWAEYEEHKTTWLADTDKIEAWRLYRTNNEPGL